jgi:hypothetical protein
MPNVKQLKAGLTKLKARKDDLSLGCITMGIFSTFKRQGFSKANVNDQTMSIEKSPNHALVCTGL